MVTEAVSHAAVRMADQLGTTAIISLTETGFTSRIISKYRPECPILAVTMSPKVACRLSMNWGILPTLYQDKHSDEAKISFAIEQAAQQGIVEPGDILIASAGHSQETGGTDLIRVLTVKP